jgi:hypothetical protein
MVRPWRGATWEIAIERGGSPRLEVDGAALDGRLLPVSAASRAGRRRVRVVV